MTAASRPRILAALPRLWATWWPLPVGIAIAAITWPVVSLVPTNGLDPSWRIALHMAAARGIDFGDIAFTYGPLGYLAVPLNAEPGTLVPALAWMAVLQAGLASLVIVAARRSFPWPVAVALAFVTCQLLDEGREVLGLIAFLWAALVVQGDVPTRVARYLLPLSGAVAGLGVLIKLNEGIVVALLLAVAAWWQPPGRWRALGVYAGAFVASVVVLWVATGNGIAGLPRWMSASIQVAGGYSGGLLFEDPTRGWEYPVFIILVSWLAWFGWLSSAALSRARRVGLGILGALFAFGLFKHGFVRHDLGHSGSTFTALLVAVAAVRWRGVSGRLAGAVGAVALIVTVLGVYGAGAGPSPATLLDPSDKMQRFADDLRLAVSPARQERMREEARAALVALHGVPPAVLAALDDHTVHVDPYETSVVWAYGLRWRPLPSFQDYVVYTRGIDRRNADALAGSDAPQRILRVAVARIDGHAPEGEGPEQLLAMICDYRQQVAVGGWQVLRKAPDRCGPEHLLASVQANAGQSVLVPRPDGVDRLVVARIHLSQPLGSRLRNILFKPRAVPQIVLGGTYGFRIPAALAGGPVLIRVPASVGWSTYAAGYSYDTLVLTDVPSPYRVDFLSIPVPASRTSTP